MRYGFGEVVGGATSQKRARPAEIDEDGERGNGMGRKEDELANKRAPHFSTPGRQTSQRGGHHRASSKSGKSISPPPQSHPLVQLASSSEITEMAARSNAQ